MKYTTAVQCIIVITPRFCWLNWFVFRLTLILDYDKNFLHRIKGFEAIKMKYLEVTIPIRGFKTTYMYWTYPRVTGKNWCYVNIYSFLNDVLKNFYNDSIFLLQYLIRPIICISRLMSRSSFYFFVSPPSHPQYYEIIMNNI